MKINSLQGRYSPNCDTLASAGVSTEQHARILQKFVPFYSSTFTMTEKPSNGYSQRPSLMMQSVALPDVISANA